MAFPRETVLNEPEVRAALWRAWLDSRPGVSGGREEGGFVLQDPNGDLIVLRWPSGAQNSIELPSYFGGKVGQSDIVATFHTHPNTGGDFIQEPSATDKRAVRDDLDLQSLNYEGEFVIASEFTYLITPEGEVVT